MLVVVVVEDGEVEVVLDVVLVEEVVVVEDVVEDVVVVEDCSCGRLQIHG